MLSKSEANPPNDSLILRYVHARNRKRQSLLNQMPNDLFFIVLSNLCRIDIALLRNTNKLNKNRINKYAALPAINNNLGLPHWFHLNNFLEPATLDKNDVFHRKLQIKLRFLKLKQQINFKNKIENIIQRFVSNKYTELNGVLSEIWRYLSKINMSQTSILIDITLENGIYYGEKELNKITDYLITAKSCDLLKQKLFKLGSICQLQCSLISSDTFDWENLSPGSNVQFIKHKRSQIKYLLQYESIHLLTFIDEYDILIVCAKSETNKKMKMKFYKVFFANNNTILNMKCIGEHDCDMSGYYSPNTKYTITNDSHIIIAHMGRLYIFHPFNEREQRLTVMKCIEYKKSEYDTDIESFFASNNKVYFVTITEPDWPRTKLSFYALSDSFEIKEIGNFVNDSETDTFRYIDGVNVYGNLMIINGREDDPILGEDDPNSLLHLYKWDIINDEINIELMDTKYISLVEQTKYDSFEGKQVKIFINSSGMVLVIANVDLYYRMINCYLYRISNDELLLLDAQNVSLYRSCSNNIIEDLREMISDDICIIFANEEIFILDLVNDKISLKRRQCLEMISEHARDGFSEAFRIRNNIFYRDDTGNQKSLQFN